MNKIEEVANERLNSSKCEQCRCCLPCPNEVPIPEILRLRNISIGYGQLEFSKEIDKLILVDEKLATGGKKKIPHFVKNVINVFLNVLVN